MTIEHRPPRSVKVRKVIEVITTRGNGVDIPVEEIVQYWSLDGRLLAEGTTAGKKLSTFQIEFKPEDITKMGTKETL